jgi:hypothetical protein
MTVVLGLAICVGFYLLVRRCSTYLYGRDRHSFLGHTPFFTAGYATIGRAAWRWLGSKGRYNPERYHYPGPDPATRKDFD